ncbi:MAG: L,D-transpeptidase family protein [Elusimicrobia bacterium]|nr:L,D-transpeptidase family protein [Elusimicrobiota bacterium]
MKIKKVLIFTIATILFLNISVFAKKKTPEVLTINRNPILNKYQNDKKVQEIICVTPVENTNAILKMYVKDQTQTSGWDLILATDAFIGKRGLGKEREGDLKTPIGIFNPTFAFGKRGNPGTTLKYVEINNNMYACDEEGKYYNQIIDVTKVKHECNGEHLMDYIPQYNYALCIDFNPKNIFPDGSNIFIHVKGNKDYTAGCIAVDEESMIKILQNTTKKTKIVIYEYEHQFGE